MSTATFLENHDQPRFQSITTDQSLVKNAMAWSFITDGVPIIYYGQEQGYTGNGDPNNREAYVSRLYWAIRILMLANAGYGSLDTKRRTSRLSHT